MHRIKYELGMGRRRKKNEEVPKKTAGKKQERQDLKGRHHPSDRNF